MEQPPPRTVPPPPPQAALPPGAQVGAAAVAPTNTLAVISLVAALVSFFPLPHPFLGGIVAIVTGHMAKKQIKHTGESGAGLATAGIIIGWIHIAASILFVLAVTAIILGLFVAVRRSSTG